MWISTQYWIPDIYSPHETPSFSYAWYFGTIFIFTRRVFAMLTLQNQLSSFSLHLFEFTKEKNKSLHKKNIEQECHLWIQFLWLILYFYPQFFFNGKNSIYLYFLCKFYCGIQDSLQTRSGSFYFNPCSYTVHSKLTVHKSNSYFSTTPLKLFCSLL